MTDEPSEPTQVRRPPRRRNPDESRRRILDAAERAFARCGFGGARLRDIAQQAGVHHALVHHYYGDKRGLFQEVIKRGLGRVSLAGRDALAGRDLETIVRSFVGVLFDFCANNKNLLRIVEDALRNREWANWDLTQEAFGALTGPLLDVLKQRIELGQRAGIVREDITAASLIMLGFGAIVYRFDNAEVLLCAMGLSERGEQDLAQEREHAIRYVLSAMRPSAAA